MDVREQESRWNMKKVICLFVLFLLIIVYSLVMDHVKQGEQEKRATLYEINEEEKETIKWVDFKVTAQALSKAYRYDVDSYGCKEHIEWIKLLALTASQTGGEFGKTALEKLDANAEKVLSGETTLDELGASQKYYDYYVEAYDAVLHGYVGEFEVEETDENGEVTFHKKYGLKAFSPIAKGFDYQDYDDFGVKRSYGYSRPHLGHDMMGLIGTPIVAVESGVIEALGWNQYGGWRIGIRSFDSKRYYYYAHLRQNFPYCKSLKEGSVVTAGDVIGYMGHTGYSAKENVNNIKTVHLHFGIELIFDEKRRAEGKELWIDCYELARFLSQNRVAVTRDDATKEWFRTYAMRDPETKKALQN